MRRKDKKGPCLGLGHVVAFVFSLAYLQTLLCHLTTKLLIQAAISTTRKARSKFHDALHVLFYDLQARTHELHGMSWDITTLPPSLHLFVSCQSGHPDTIASIL